MISKDGSFYMGIIGQMMIVGIGGTTPMMELETVSRGDVMQYMRCDIPMSSEAC